MTTSRKTHFLSEIEQKKPIPHGTLAYFEERLRNNLYELVIEKYLDKQKSEGLSQAELARRIHKKPEVVNRLLGAPGNWTLATVSNLLMGICGEELIPSSLSVLGRPVRNHKGPDYIKSQRPNNMPRPENDSI